MTFFKVCMVSPQASAITSFFRLLSLPGPTLYDLVSNVFAWDLDGDASASLSGGFSPLRIGLISLATPANPEASVVLRPPTSFSMQIIVPHIPTFQEQQVASSTVSCP